MRLPLRRTGWADEAFRWARRRALLRGAGKLVAVVAVAGVGGALLGLGLSKLGGDDHGATPAAAAATTAVTAAAPAPSGPPQQSSTGKLRVDVLSTIVHPVTADARRRASVGVHVRVTNASARVVRPVAPVLLVGDTALALAPGSAGAAAPLVRALRRGAIADGRLSFDTTGADTRRLTSGRVRLRVAGKTLVLTPRAGSARSR